MFFVPFVVLIFVSFVVAGQEGGQQREVGDVDEGRFAEARPMGEVFDGGEDDGVVELACPVGDCHLQRAIPPAVVGIGERRFFVKFVEAILQSVFQGVTGLRKPVRLAALGTQRHQLEKRRYRLSVFQQHGI